MPQENIWAWRCNRCQHIWTSRKTKKPITCPKCRSAYWDEPRKASKQVK